MGDTITRHLERLIDFMPKVFGFSIPLQFSNPFSLQYNVRKALGELV